MRDFVLFVFVRDSLPKSEIAQRWRVYEFKIAATILKREHIPTRSLTIVKSLLTCSNVMSITT